MSPDIGMDPKIEFQDIWVSKNLEFDAESESVEKVEQKLEG
jgi:hypothetical protein